MTKLPWSAADWIVAVAMNRAGTEIGEKLLSHRS